MLKEPKALFQPDCNLYLAFGDMLTKPESVDMPTTSFKEAIRWLEDYLNVETECEIAKYYNTLLQHEVNNFYETELS
jgi:hypothetical protein